MRAQRFPAVINVAHVSLLVIFSVALAAPPGGFAQQQGQQKKYQPAPPGQSATETPARSLNEVDDKPVLVNADLITLTVTVTDMYGRFVTGLGKNAFSIFDEKQQQDISFFSDEDAPVRR
jgi:hypothetical protein